MGYRSQVCLAVGKEVLPQFLLTMAKSPETRAMCFSHAEKTIKDYDGEGGMLFYWDHIKWYDSYEEIQAIENFLDWCDSEDIPTDEKNADGETLTRSAADFVKFVRTGENEDDNESRGCGFDDIYITRSIEF